VRIRSLSFVEVRHEKRHHQAVTSSPVAKNMKNWYFPQPPYLAEHRGVAEDQHVEAQVD